MVDSLVLTTFIISLIITIVCFNTIQNSVQRVLLTVFFGCIATQTGLKFLVLSTSIIKLFPFISGISEFLAIIIPEIIFLYVLSIVNKPIERILIFKLTILPIVGMLFFGVFFVLTNAFTIDEFYAFECFVGLLTITFLSNIVFLSLSLKEINTFLNSNLIELTKNNHIKLIWIKWLLWLFLIKATFTLAFFATQYFFMQAEWFPLLTEYQKTFSAIITLVATSLTGYYALRNPMLFDTITESPTIEQSIAISFLAPEVKKVIKKTNVKPEEINDYLSRIEKTILQERLFLDSTLSANSLALKVGIPVYKLTFVLNKGAEKNFNEFINNYRIEYAKEMLNDPKQNRKTIYSIALDCGFSSEAPFYVAFKKMVGKSPSAYKNSLERIQENNI
jgi:AraC-like DNA-binding protein